MPPVRVMMVGFGRLARLVAGEVLRGGTADTPGIAVTGILTRSHGALFDPSGVNLSQLLESFENDPDTKLPAGESALDAIRHGDYDALLELTPLMVHDQAGAARSHVLEALRRSKSVVTANKGPAAFAFHDIARACAEHRVQYLDRASMMGGMPIVSMVREAVRETSVSSLMGIFSPSANVVLEQMEDRVAKEHAVADAVRRGLMQQDPQLDLDGSDSAAVLAILASALMDARLTPPQVSCRGYGRLVYTHLHKALSQGKTHRLIARAWREGDTVKASVSPELVSLDDPWASVTGTTQVLRVERADGTAFELRQLETSLGTLACTLAADLFRLRSR